MATATILVVDDDPEIVSFLHAALEDEGYTVIDAVDGAAIEVAHAQQPSLILLDILMPKMDGIEVSRRLRADPATVAIPIIAMSAQDRLQSTRGQISADDRLPKPFDLKSLYEKVARWAKTTDHPGTGSVQG